MHDVPLQPTGRTIIRQPVGRLNKQHHHCNSLIQPLGHNTTVSLEPILNKITKFIAEISILLKKWERPGSGPNSRRKQGEPFSHLLFPVRGSSRFFRLPHLPLRRERHTLPTGFCHEPFLKMLEEETPGGGFVRFLILPTVCASRRNTGQRHR